MTASDLLADALAAHRAGRPEAAVPLYRALLEGQPENPDLRHLLALALHGGDAKAAAAELNRALALAPSTGLYLHNAARLAGADESRHARFLARALAADSEAAAEAHHRLGAMAVRAARHTSAASRFRRALALDPGFPPALFDLANLAADAGDDARAIAGYRRLLAATEHADGLAAYGALLKRRGRSGEAAALFARIVRLTPDRLEAHGALGAALAEAEDDPGAVAALHRALALVPAAAEIWYTLGLVYGRNPAASAEAIAVADRAVLIAPALAEAHLTRALAFFHQGRIREAIAARRAVLALSPADAQAHYEFLSFLHLDPDLAPQDQFAYRRRVHRRFSDPLTRTAAPHANDPDPERRLKLGYLDNCMLYRSTHSANLLPTIEAHDPKAVELFFYTNLPAAMADDMTGRYRAKAAGFHLTEGLSDEAVAARMRADEIDILIDIASHLTGARARVCAMKPAPIQVTMFQVGSSGMAAMDYAVADPEFLSMRRPALFTEQILPIPVGYVFDVPSDMLPPVSVPRPDRPLTFGSLNLLAKIGEPVLALWARVLRQVPDSRLLLKAAGLAAPVVRQRLAGFFEGHGISPARLDLRALVQGYDRHLSTYDEIDIVLDCFPYPGITTSIEAILMGVPVVTLKGDRFVSRFSEAILSAIGHPEWIARDEDGYVAIAARLAAVSDERIALRRALRSAFLSSPINDPVPVVRAVEDGLRRAWRAWCGSRRQSRHD
jgi:predicted O-linked N-acetylglucosamine transferase (SPINDLY family)